MAPVRVPIVHLEAQLAMEPCSIEGSTYPQVVEVVQCNQVATVVALVLVVLAWYVDSRRGLGALVHLEMPFPSSLPNLDASPVVLPLQSVIQVFSKSPIFPPMLAAPLPSARRCIQ